MEYYAASLTALVCPKIFAQRSKRGLLRAFSRSPTLQCPRSMCRTPGSNPVQARKSFPRTYTHMSASIGLLLAVGCPQKMYVDSLPMMPLVNFTSAITNVLNYIRQPLELIFMSLTATWYGNLRLPYSNTFGSTKVFGKKTKGLS